MTGEDLRCRTGAVEHQVGLLDGGLFLTGEPITLTAQKERLQLCIDLGMVDAGAVNGVLHLHADEPAAARRVREQFVAVGGGDEGGDAGQSVRVALVGLAHVQGW